MAKNKTGDIKEPYFIKKRHLYFRPNCAGYTEEISRAGIYEKHYALDYLENAKKHNDNEINVMPVYETGWTVLDITEKIETLEVILKAQKKAGK